MALSSGRIVMIEDHKHMICCYWEGCHNHTWAKMEVVDSVTKFSN